MQNKTCERCGASYNPNVITQKYCPTCGGIMAMQRARERKERWRAREKERREERRLLERERKLCE